MSGEAYLDGGRPRGEKERGEEAVSGLPSSKDTVLHG